MIPALLLGCSSTPPETTYKTRSECYTHHYECQYSNEHDAYLNSSQSSSDGSDWYVIPLGIVVLPFYAVGWVLMNAEPAEPGSFSNPTQVTASNCYQNVHGQMICYTEEFQTEMPVYDCFKDVHNNLICHTET